MESEVTITRPAKPLRATTRYANVFDDAPPVEFNATLRGTACPCRIDYDDHGPDADGRRRFSLTWDQDHGSHYLRRAQCFFAVPSNHIGPPLIDLAVIDLPTAIDVSTGLPADVCGVACFIEAMHVDVDGNFTEFAVEDDRVRVHATMVEVDRVAVVDVDATAGALLSDVLRFILDHIGPPTSWPMWRDSNPVLFSK